VLESKEVAKKDKSKTYLLTQGDYVEDTDFTIAKCCSPIPGDDVIGYRNTNNDVVIHRKTCPQAIKLMSSHGNMLLDAQWAKQKFFSFLAQVSLQGVDRQGIIAEISSLISKDLDVNMRKVLIESHDGVFEGFIDLYVHDVNNLNNLILKIGKVKGVVKVARVELNRTKE